MENIYIYIFFEMIHRFMKVLVYVVQCVSMRIIEVPGDVIADQSVLW